MVISKTQDFFKMSLQNLKRRKTRSLLTMLGIIIGVAAIVALISISQGMSNAIESQLNSLGSQMIRISPGSLRGPPVGLVGLTENDVDTVKGINELDYVMPLLIESAEVSYGNEKQLITVVAIPVDLLDDYAKDAGIELEQGRFLKSESENSVLITEKVASDKFDKQMYIKSSIEFEDRQFKVVGIIKNTGGQTDDRIIIPFDLAKEVYDKGENVGLITARVKDNADMDKVAEEIERKLKRSRNDENFVVYTPEQVRETVNAILGVVNVVLIGIASISILVGAIGIMNSMFTSVLERTREIGVMKAIGAKNSDVLYLFLIESGFMGLLGGIIGIIIGTGMAFIFGFAAKAAGFPFMDVQINLNLIIAAASFSFLLGMVSGALPAIRASKLKPVEALRYE
ncbi:MAG: ABC transporter permease [Nanoarchaeota archaeon]|nr:ABC transporter permease [Nanoarchaeota archaeon]